MYLTQLHVTNCLVNENVIEKDYFIMVWRKGSKIIEIDVALFQSLIYIIRKIKLLTRYRWTYIPQQYLWNIWDIRKETFCLILYMILRHRCVISQKNFGTPKSGDFFRNRDTLCATLNGLGKLCIDVFKINLFGKKAMKWLSTPLEYFYVT